MKTLRIALLVLAQVLVIVGISAFQPGLSETGAGPAPVLQTMQAPSPDPHPDETPEPPGPDPGTPLPTAPPAPPTNIISQIFHYLTFPARTLSDALQNIMSEAAQDEARNLERLAGEWALWIGEVVQAPSAGHYQAIAQGSLAVAAALAPALFVFRLALYHWRRLAGEDDAALTVLSDWLSSAAMAVVAGPFLDLVVRLCWWMAGAALGETSQLAYDYVRSISIVGIAETAVGAGMFFNIVIIGVSFLGVLAIIGLLFAFAAAQAALYVLAVLAMPLAIAGVIPQMRWLRSLWIKAVAIISLLPVVAGGVFKAATLSGGFFPAEGLLTLLIRLMWLAGAVGALFSLAGILGRMTISASTEAAGKLVGAIKSIAATAALALAAGATAGAGAGAIGAGAGASGAAGGAGGMGGGAGAGGGMAGGDGAAAGAAAGGGGGPPGGSGGGGFGLQGALGHYQAAAGYTQRATAFDALGLRAPAQYLRSQARMQELAARQDELQERMARLSGVPDEASNDATGDETGKEHGPGAFGFSPSVSRRIASSFPGPADEFEAGYSCLSPHIQRLGLSPQVVAQTYPEETARMVQAARDNPQIVQADDPLLEAARLGMARNFLCDVYGESLEPKPPKEDD